ncbi:GatB/YqeY domain-containing protein [Ferriphaselus sp. R-1]|uniref:GatB/YqeY domain-containing protein n=1 Tax=Ferriphaselus sp. R-1 TaxID=1485544 RepID=UPI000557D9BA|nr:GatB/YqeY domain-containing protein [Ferriphaselus sp. R-1]
MSLKTQISDDMKSAMRAKDSARLGTIRLLLAAIKQWEVDERIELDDVAVVAVIEKMLKQRRDSISQYQGAARQDLVEVEQAEVSVLQTYMPQQLDESEIAGVVAECVAAVAAAGPQDMGKVMAVLKPKLAGRADMGKVSVLLKAHLAK